MKFLTSGCSFTGQESTRSGWPVWLEDLGTVRNLGMPGAGNEYIAESVIHEISTTGVEYDVVMVMWSGLQRIDLRVDPLVIADKNLCPLSGINYLQLGDYFIQKEYKPLIVNGNELTRGYKSIMEMIKLQSFLQSKQIRYYFMSYVNYWNDKEEITNRNFGIYKYPLLATLSKQLDFGRFIFANNNDCIFETASSIKNGLSEDNFHPSFHGTDRWMNNVVFPVLRNAGIC